MLMKAVAVDSQAVQRHRATILECVKVLALKCFYNSLLSLFHFEGKKYRIRTYHIHIAVPFVLEFPPTKYFEEFF